MRIISGIYKGKRLTAPKTLPVRPTTDFAKEGLFNILHHRIDFEEVTVLDLFSGTGNIAYEFASRGSKAIMAIDSDFGCVKFIKKTALELELPIEALKLDVFKYIQTGNSSYDIVFADPPYAIETDLLKEMVKNVFDHNWLKEDGLLIVEHPKQVNLSEIAQFTESRKYGSSVFSFFSHPE
jgi:16S rRNA (guanine966-N2)-methyltransferase